jgi:hypothetical protein
MYYFDCSLVAEGKRLAFRGKFMGARASWVQWTLKGKMRAFGCFLFFRGELDSLFLKQYILIFVCSKQGSHRFGRLLVPLVCRIWDSIIDEYFESSQAALLRNEIFPLSFHWLQFL